MRELDATTESKLKSMMPAERVAIVFRLNAALRAGLGAVIRSLHPDWSDAEVRREISCRMLSGDGSVDSAIRYSFALAEPRSAQSLERIVAAVSEQRDV